MSLPAYLNHAGTSLPRAPGVAEALARAVDAAPEELNTLFEGAIAELAAHFAVPPEDLFLPTPGATAALALAIGDLPWQPGDVALTSSMEHQALAGPIERLARTRGVVVRAIPATDDSPLDLAALERALERAQGRARLVALTMASNVTGEVLPWAEAARLAHRHGALALFDTAQYAGLESMDLPRCGADIATFAGHKGLLGPQGIGLLWARAGVEFASPWAACEVGASGPRAPCAPRPSYCDVGSVNLAGLVGLAAAARWSREHGGLARWAHARGLARRLREHLLERAPRGLTPVRAAGAAEYTAALAVALEPTALARAEATLRAHGVVARAGLHCAPQAHDALALPHGTLRLSFGPFSTDDDLARAIAGLAALESG